MLFRSQIKRPKLPVKGKPQQPLTRRPLFWILLATVVVTFVGQISSGGNQFTKVETSQVMSAITRGDVEQATIVDRQQVIRLVLKPGSAIEGATNVEASYVSGQEPILVDLLSASPPPKSGMLKFLVQISLSQFFSLSDRFFLSSSSYSLS